MSTCNLYVLLLLICPAVKSGKTLLAAGQDQNVAGAEAVVWIDVLDHLSWIKSRTRELESLVARRIAISRSG